MSPPRPSFHLADLVAGWSSLRRPMWLFDPRRLRGVYANPPALALWDADSSEELLARDFSGLSPAVQARTQRLADATAEGGELTESWTFFPKGRPVTVQATISTIRLHGAGDVLLFEAAPLDVEPEERRSVEALRHAATLISLFDAEGRVLFSNPAAFAANGSGDHPFAGRFADPALGAEIFARALAGEVVTQVCEMVTPRGRAWRHLDARRVPDPVTGAAGVLLNEQDVTARIEAEAARAAAEQRAAMAEARQEFLAEMSHELRTPLNAVIGFAELLTGEGRAPQDVEFAQRIREGGTRLLTVVNQMIALADSDGSAQAPTSLPGSPDRATARGVADGAPDPAGCRVLYVDDNASNRALISAMLASLGVDCETADDGRQGVEAARGGRWDLILMDIQMPVMNGVEATRAIRGSAGPESAVPIVALTANTAPQDLETYLQAGMNDCVAKPVELAKLAAAVATWARRDVAAEQDPGARSVRAERG